MSFMGGYGPKAYPTVSLMWGLLGISIAVVVIIAALVPIGVIRRRRRSVRGAFSEPIENPTHGLNWITIGVGISSVVLVASIIWTVAVLAAENKPPKPAPLTIEVTGLQWWWKVRYLSKDPSQIFTTANEIHIPVGQPVRVKLIGGDVIHSFWVPALTGKTDAIPGQTNVTWLQADRPGRWRGQCTEYCGVQHAHMALYVIADPPSVFAAWRAHQAQDALAPTTPEAVDGEKLFVYRCGACHKVRGTDAGGTVAPDLTHLMTRKTIAAGVLPNTPAGLSGWIANPQAVKPGTRMPTLYLSGPELKDVRSYLEGLQ